MPIARMPKIATCVGHRQEVGDREVVRRQDREDDDDDDQREKRAAFEQHLAEDRHSWPPAGRPLTPLCRPDWCRSFARPQLRICGGRVMPLDAAFHAPVRLDDGARGALVGDQPAHASRSQARRGWRRALLAPPATATMRLPRRRSSGSVTMRRVKSVSIGWPVVVKKCPSTSPAAPRRLSSSISAGSIMPPVTREALSIDDADADQHEIARLRAREGLGALALVQEHLAVGQRVRHEGNGHDEGLRPEALRQAVDHLMRIGRGAPGEAAHQRDQLGLRRRLVAERAGDRLQRPAVADADDEIGACAEAPA